MADSSGELPADISVWTAANISSFLSSLALPQYTPSFLTERITGEMMCVLDHDSMRDLGVTSVGHRLTILRAIWKYKRNSPYELEGWTPPSTGRAPVVPPKPDAASQTAPQLSKEDRERFDRLERLHETFSRQDSKSDSRLRYLEDSYAKVFTWSEMYRKELTALTKQINELRSSSLASPSASAAFSTPTTSASSVFPSASSILTPSTSNSTLAPAFSPYSGAVPPSPSPKVSHEDLCEKVLREYLRKQNITEPWELYALLITYDSDSSGTPTTAGGRPKPRQERCVALDEQPLRIFQEFRSRGLDPKFQVKHRRELVSPIVRALAKSNGNSKRINAMGNPRKEGRTRMTTLGPSDGISWAFGIYPYTTEAEDELDVSYNDAFVVFKKEVRHGAQQGFVQRDLQGTGASDSNSPTGWVPMGCLLETASPIPPSSQGAKIQLNFTRVSAPSTVLLDYSSNVPSEVNLRKDERVHVFKKLGTWYFVAKTDNGERGWAPSWHLGKVRYPAASPSPSSTPNTTTHLTGSSNPLSSANLQQHEHKQSLQSSYQHQDRDRLQVSVQHPNNRDDDNGEEISFDGGGNNAGAQLSASNNGYYPAGTLLDAWAESPR